MGLGGGARSAMSSLRWCISWSISRKRAVCESWKGSFEDVAGAGAGGFRVVVARRTGEESEMGGRAVREALTRQRVEVAAPGLRRREASAERGRLAPLDQQVEGADQGRSLLLLRPVDAAAFATTTQTTSESSSSSGRRRKSRARATATGLAAAAEAASAEGAATRENSSWWCRRDDTAPPVKSSCSPG